MDRTVAEIEKLIAEWQALRAEYAGRGSTGIVTFIDSELIKLRAERARQTTRETDPELPAA